MVRRTSLLALCLAICAFCSGCTSGSPSLSSQSSYSNYQALQSEELPFASRQQIEQQIVGHKISSRIADFDYGADESYVMSVPGKNGIEYHDGTYRIHDGKICKTAGTYPCLNVYNKNGLIVIDYGPNQRIFPMRDDAPCQAALRNANHDRLAPQEKISVDLSGHTVVLSSGETDEFYPNGSFRDSRGKLGTYSIRDGQMIIKYQSGGTCRAVTFTGADYAFISPYGDRWTVVSR